MEKISITEGKFITGGLNFAIDIKDVSVHITRKPYMQKLRAVSSKFFVFWDNEAKRGWLIKGTSALLHLLRASLKYYEADAFREALLSKSDDILEPSAESTEDYSITVLRDERNMKLPIYPDKNEVGIHEERRLISDNLRAPRRSKKYYRVENQIEELYEVMEKLIDHQINITGQAGVKMKASVRRRIEGWDFKDLASDKNPIYPHVATLYAVGKGWIDFVRSIQAVILFGTGYGQLIKESGNRNCPQWTEVPKGKFYLAACVSDLQQIMEMDGDSSQNLMRLCNGISWYTPGTAFNPCQCTTSQEKGHSNFIQTL
jgi:hypothetical protein